MHVQSPNTFLRSIIFITLLGGIVSWLCIDIPLRDYLYAHPNELLRWTTWVLGRPGQTVFWVVGCLLMSVLAYRHSPYCPALFRDTSVLRQFCIQLVIALTLSGLIVTFVKYGVGRPRPSEFFRSGAVAFHPFDSSPRYASFPSGHSQTVWAGVATCLLFFPHARVWLVVAGIFGCVGRVVMLRHYPSDICAGAIVGIWGALAARQIVTNPRVIGWITPRWRAFIRWIDALQSGRRRSSQAPQ